MKTIGMGSIFNILFTNSDVRNYRDMWKANIPLRQEIDMELLNLGVYLKPLNRYSMSIAHTLKDIDDTVNAQDRKSTRLNSSHVAISYAVFCLKKKTN